MNHESKERGEMKEVRLRRLREFVLIRALRGFLVDWRQL